MANDRLAELFHKEMTRKQFLGVTTLAFVSIFGVSGLIGELLSHASTPVVSSEGEAGTLANGTTVINDSTASNGKAIQFGSTSTVALAAPIAPPKPQQAAVVPATTSPYDFPVSDGEPSWLVTLSGPRFHNVFYTGEAITLSMGSAGATAWKATDIDGNVSTGSISSAARSFTVTKPSKTPANAWIAVEVTGPNNDPKYGNLYGSTAVHLWNKVSTIPTAPSWDDSWDGPTDQAWNGVMSALVNYGPQRFNVQDATQPTYDVQNILSVLNYDVAWWSGHGSANRPRANFCSFPNGAVSSAELAGVTSTVKSLYPTVQWFEGPSNEPQDGSATVTASQVVAFAAAVRAGNPNAKVMGPSCVTFNVSESAWLTTFLKALPAGTLDALSIHGYNTSIGDLAMTDNTLTNLKTVLANTGNSNLPVFMTEGCGEFTDVYGVVHWRRSAHWIGMRYLLYEAYGIPRERQCFFYPDSNGFWDFPSFLWAADDNSDAPAIDFFRGLQERTYNAKYTRRLDFGTPGNLLFFGSIYTSPTDQCAVLLAGGSPTGSVTLNIGTNQTATVYDWVGNSTVQNSDSSGHITVPVGDLPTYVSCALSASISVADADNGLLSAGSDLATSATFSSSAATSSNNNAGPLSYLNNGQFEYGFYNSSGGNGGTLGPIQWQSTGSPPVWVMGVWQKTQTVGRVIISTAPPWQSQCGLETFTLSTWNGSSWVTQYSFNDPLAISTPFMRSTDSWGSYVETFWKEQCLWDIVLPSAVKTNGILLTVTKTSYGGEPDVLSGDVYGRGQNGPTVVNLREIMAFSS